MDTLFALLAFATLILMVVGLFSPKRALFWSNKKQTRKRVLLIYSLAFIISMTLFDMTYSEENETTEESQEDKVTDDKEAKKEDPSDDQADTSSDSDSAKSDKKAEDKSPAADDSSNDTGSSSKEKNNSSKEDKFVPSENNTSKQQDNSPDTNATVSHVVDGDTIEINYKGTKEDVRLLLVDTPEVHGVKQKFGPEASAFAKELLKPGTKVKYETDGPKRDHYGRLLGYLWVNGELFNEKLLENGLARYAYVYDPPYKYQNRLKQAETRARNQGIGIWSIDGYVMSDGFAAGASSSGSSGGSPSGESDSDNDSGAAGNAGGSDSSSGLKYDPNGPDRDCGDFDTQAEAQAFYEAAGGPGSDPYRLDGHDGDGVVCESLP
ncbi:thermonuclease family protein [Thalassobacillus devorans]|uniref:thermonuclease family protein n=1 Tax=Thalassobacillus devorans TaxID=279813 RepID=UPI0004B2440A|nr:thermonuclease family protein [Thalassobacillus devorans]